MAAQTREPTNLTEVETPNPASIPSEQANILKLQLRPGTGINSGAVVEDVRLNIRLLIAGS